MSTWKKVFIIVLSAATLLTLILGFLVKALHTPSGLIMAALAVILFVQTWMTEQKAGIFPRWKMIATVIAFIACGVSFIGLTFSSLALRASVHGTAGLIMIGLTAVLLFHTWRVENAA